MEIVAALFVEQFNMRQAAGPSARLDLTGAYFSMAAPSEPPFTITPHLVVIERCPADHPGTGVLEVRFIRDGEQVARNVQPLQIEPGKFNYNLVQPQLAFDGYDTVEAHVRLDQGPTVIVPLTLLPPA